MKNIIEKYKFGIKAIIKNITGSYNEDLEQEVYIKAWKNREQYTERSKFGSWIYKIAQNTSKDFLKSSFAKNQKNLELNADKLLLVKDQRQNPENEFNTKLRQKKIIEAIEKLPSKQREVIVLYDMHDLSYEQIAQKLGCPVGTVRSRLFNARKELAEALKDLL